jgi:hypothetical protein
MSDIVILTAYADIHAAAVGWALRQMGESPKLWMGCEFPRNQEASIAIGEAGLTGFSLRADNETILALDNTKAVWNRRPSLPVLPSAMHEADRPAAQRECEKFVNAMTEELFSSGFWVNPKISALRANHKPHQLKVAAACGLAIPDTLFSNCPADIAAFYHKHHGQIIYKTFLQPHWKSDEREVTSTFFTTLLPEAALDEVFSLRNVPGIYQPKVEKQYEVRLTMMGGHAFAVKIDSQSDDKSKLDWRQDLEVKCAISGIDIPQDVLDKCRGLMKRLGLVFGCIDLIVTPDDRYVFLEVNEMGQFLWLDYFAPELRMLEVFAGFLASCDPSYAEPARRSDISYARFLETDECAQHRQESRTTKRGRNLAVRE